MIACTLFLFLQEFFPNIHPSGSSNYGAFSLAVNQNEVVTGGVGWPAVGGESTHNVTWLSLDRNDNNCGMTFENDFTSNVTINKDIIPMQRSLRSKARAEAELIAKVRRDLCLDEMNLSINLECLELDHLDCEHVKSPISNKNCANNHVGNEYESCKNRCKMGMQRIDNESKA